MQKREGVPYILLIAFMIAGVCLFGLGVVKQKERTEQLRKYEMTWGYISDSLVRGKNSDMYAAEHSYKVDGKEYTFRDYVYTRKEPKVGKREKIMYNPNDPSEAFVKDRFTIPQALLLFGSLAVIYPILIIVATSCNIADKWREFIKCMLLGGVFAGGGFGFCFGGIGRLNFLSVVCFILGCFGAYFIGYGFYSLRK